MKIVRAMLMVLAVAACDGGGGGDPVDPVVPPFDGFTPEALEGYTAAGKAAALNSGNFTEYQTVKAEFGANDTVIVTKNDGTRTPVLTYDTVRGAYYDANLTYVLFVVSDPDNPDVAVMAFGDYSLDPVNYNNWVEQFFIAGNRTDPGAIPLSGSASYSGTLYVDAVYFTTEGSVDLAVDFATARIGGGVGFTGDSGTTFAYDLTAAPITDGSFTTTLKAPGSGLTSGVIDGAFYDPTGAEIAGTLQIDSPDGAVIGGYIAER